MNEDKPKSEEKSWLQAEKERELERERITIKRIKEERKRYFEELKEEAKELEEDVKEEKVKEGKPEQPEKQKLSPEMSMSIKKVFDSFLARSNEPGLPYSEQLKLWERSVKGDQEASRQYLESKQSKYRVNSLTGVLLAAELFLDESKKAEKISFTEPSLRQRIEKVMQDIEEERKGNLTEKTVKEVVAIVKEIEPYLE